MATHDEILRFSGDDLDLLAEDLRLAADAVHVETMKTVLEVGEEVKEAAKVVADAEGLHSVSPTIEMIPAPDAALIRAGGDSPLAALEELGNKGAKRSATTFRHPVFGKWLPNVKPQKKHPFLAPALAASRRQITKRMEETWDRALEPFRLKPED
jgi:hypothetical protein